MVETIDNEIVREVKINFNQFIGEFENALDQDIIDGLLDWYDFAAKTNYVINPRAGLENSKVFSNVKEQALKYHGNPYHVDECIVLPTSSVFTKNNFPGALCREYFDHLVQCYEAYDNEYGINHRGILSNPFFKIHKVLPGEGYHVWHYENDSFSSRDRFITYMTYLKVPESGGETEFLHQSARIEPKAGTTLLWPAGYTHRHRGNPPLKGEKIYITGWFMFLPTPEELQETGVLHG